MRDTTSPRRWRVEGPAEVGAPRPSLGSRLAWFAGLGLASSAATAGVAYALRALLKLG